MQKARIMRGQAAGRFAPDKPATRAEVAQMLYAYHNWRKSGDNKPDHVSRGCPACHNVRQIGNRRLDLRLGVQVTKLDGHPKVSENAGVDDCKMCHRPGGLAKLMLSTIVHPIHFNSAIFRKPLRWTTGESPRNLRSARTVSEPAGESHHPGETNPEFGFPDFRIENRSDPHELVAEVSW